MHELIRIYKEYGTIGIIFLIMERYNLNFPFSVKSKWKIGTISELMFWDNYYKTKGGRWKDKYEKKFDINLPLQSRPIGLLPIQKEVEILDVGAGPMTYLGKKHEDKILNIIAIDPLADEYNKILNKYNITPPIRTQKLAAEEILIRFNEERFDFVFARNCIDHSYNPVEAIFQMIKVVKSGCCVLLEHLPNEAVNENYKGLHQWNFSISESGDFIIGSRYDTVNITQKYADLCKISCEMVNDDLNWLVARIKKL